MRFLLTAFIAGESLLLFLPQLPNESLWFWLLTSLGFCLLLIAFFSLIKRQALNKISFCILVYILFALGFTWSGYLTHERINNDLPQNLEGVPLLVEGVVDGLPSQGTQSLRFSMTVESVLSDDELIQIDLQYFPKRSSLGWYPGWRGETVVPEIKPGQRWRLPVVLKRAHGLMNPHGFDFERWMFQQNLGATGSVKAHAKGLPRSWRPKLINEFDLSFTTMVELSRWQLRERIKKSCIRKFTISWSVDCVGDG